MENRANELLRADNAGVKRVPFAAAIKRATTHQEDFVLPMSTICGTSSIWMPFVPPVSSWAWIRWAALRCPTGSRSMPVYRLDITVVNPKIDPTFSFMTVDHDGKIRMDCSSPYAMARLVGLKDQVSRGIRQRSGLGPARHRHAVRRA